MIIKCTVTVTLASADAGGTTWVYVPPVRTGEAGRVTPVDMGVRQSGLNEAKERLDELGISDEK